MLDLTNLFQKIGGCVLLIVCFSTQGWTQEEPTTVQIDSMIQAVGGLGGGNSVSEWCAKIDKINDLAKEIGYGKGSVECNIRLSSVLVRSEASVMKEPLDELDSIYAIDPSAFSDLLLFRYYCMKGAYFNLLYDRVNQLKFYLKADSVAQQQDDVQMIVNSYNNLSAYYESTGRSDQAIEYNQLVLNVINDESGPFEDFARTNALLNIGMIYGGSGEPDSAILYLRRSMALGSHRVVIRSTQYLYLSQAYLTKNMLDSAEKYSRLTLENLSTGVDRHGVAKSYNVLGKIYLKKQQVDSALYYLDQGYRLADTISSLTLKIESQKSQIRALLIKAGYDESIVDSLNHNADLHFENKLTKQDKELMAQFQAEKKELVISKLNLENSRKEVVIAAITLLSCLVILFLIYRFRSRKKILRKTIENRQLENTLLNFELEKAIDKVKDHSDTIQQLKEGLKQQGGDVEMIDELSKLLDQSYVSDSHWLKIINYFDKLNDNYTERLKKKYPGLSKNDIRTLVLTKAGYSNKAIAEVKNVSESSVKKAKQRILAKVQESSIEGLLA